MGEPRTIVVFDGDDTLWKTQQLYAAATAEFYRRLEELGFDQGTMRSLFRFFNRPRLDDARSGRERRNSAIKDTYAALCREKGWVPDPQVMEELLAPNEQVYKADPEPLEGAQEVLSALADQATLVFFSGGEDAVQRSRLAKTSLGACFDGRIYVMPLKDTAALRHVLEEEGAEPGQTWMVGNSPRFDINPALGLGLTCIWLHTGFWRGDIEEFAPQPTFVAFALHEVLGIISQGSPLGSGGNVALQQDQSEIKLWLEGRGVNAAEAMLVGTSLTHDINPGLELGFRCVWLYAVPKEGEQEASRGKIYVAFSRGRVEEILSSHWNRNSEGQVLWRTRGDHDGARPEVND
ncbi:MAG: HAD hydrolase-like protein [Anaerolineae bacterium]|nr:HAD hydrolase-like protein [Anaerolineae bacterium]NIN93565.1 HAD hydrolase-like protein [Anaerolineae bacterium]NIQ76648.1 HAD hydrolase-like protein [Anaerolineae bacterium]